MTKFRVPVVITFDAVVFLEAEDEEEAERKVNYEMIRGNLEYMNKNKKILGFVYDDYGVALRANNESIEEVEKEI